MKYKTLLAFALVAARGGSGMIYYTYSPLQGTYYYVVNI